MYNLISSIAFLSLAVLAACHTANETIALLRSGQGRFIQQNNAYFLFNRNSFRDPVRLLATAAGASGSSAHFRTNTVVVIHGEGTSSSAEANIVIRDALLTAEDVSVILLDWTWGSYLPQEVAPMVAPEAAAGLAEMIRLYIVSPRINAGRLHIVGFGIGAHIAGIAARTLKGLNANYEVARVTGLDPTGDLWDANADRLKPTDAKLVEVIHTDMTDHGTAEALGHLDFYINGGMNQPGCEIQTMCSHDRAWEVFAASLTHSLEGNKCSGDIPLQPSCRGFAVPVGNNQLVKFGNGVFFVEAPSDKYPYTSAGCLSVCTAEDTPDDTTLDY